ncbi:glycerate kinase [Pseudarthrobacter sp. AG30]|uniref:glycerate kinase n=1 Tax=Pseudarthrobacter sp. AG30 TaxID=2249742 RepID=UPI000D651491|nr:glycerate kinase [Pseudarthrobacter sp. AG30]RAX18642.1 glycerate kinase [Pseudarthrobacter sp. AG30]
MPANTTVRALIAPDKFKGSLTAGEVAHALAAGLRSTAGAARTIECELLPLADGGDGSVDAAVSAGFARHACTVTGPTGQTVRSSIAFDGVTAVVEVANTCGIALLADGSLDALNASSRGFGEAVRFALGLSPARIVLALGGSASTDGGMGMLSALGYAFLAADGTELPGTGHALGRIHAVRGSLLPGLAGTELVVASDVSNPLTGPARAAAVFGPQKGAGPADVAALDAGLEHFVGRMADAGFGAAAGLARHDGAGSAGGIGFACLLLGARQVSGADFFLDLLGFDARKDGCDVVITGEGSIDAQTLAGKLPAAVARRSGTRTLIAVAGRSLLPRERWADLSLTQVYALADYTSRDTAKDPMLSAALLTRIGRDIGRQIGQGIRQPGRFVPPTGCAAQ